MRVVTKGNAPSSVSQKKQQGFRRRGRDAFVANLPFGGLLLDASFLPVHAPRKILIPHSTITMADTSVATANTLSTEATLILSLRFPAPLAVYLIL